LARAVEEAVRGLIGARDVVNEIRAHSRWAERSFVQRSRSRLSGA